MRLMTLDDVRALRKQRLVRLAATWMPKAVFDDDTLLSALQVEEAQAENRLRIPLTPMVCLPAMAAPEEEAALKAANTRYEVEPGYDYDPAYFEGDRWGLIEVRHRPIINVTRIAFVYPDTRNIIWDVPLSWVRADKKYGLINLVPTQQIASLPLNSFILSLVGGGRTVPFMVHVWHTAGLENPRRDYPDLIDCIYRATALGILEGDVQPTSGSLSIDGLSESQTLDLEKAHKQLDDRWGRLDQALNGLRMVTV